MWKFEMIFFITANPNHFTNKKTIETFKKKKISFEILSPIESDDFFIEKFKEYKDLLLLAKPDHWNIYHICDIALDRGIECINSAEITKKFNNRWEIENSFKILMDSKADQKLKNKFKIPESWYLLAGDVLTSNENRDFYKEIEEKFGEIILNEGMVVKFPVNHSGFHFIKKINDFEELKKIKVILDRSGLIIQRLIKDNGKVYKCYCLGNAILTQIKSDQVTNLSVNGINNESTMENILENNLITIPAGMKSDRKTIPTPPEFEELMKFIFINYKGLKIFGVDFVKKGDKYYIVDINDFPGCRGLEESGEIIANYVLQYYQRNIIKK